MAIADAEPKKGEVDVTSTGSGSSSKEMKKPRGPIKYSSLKDFSFSVSDVWDDRNICTFIECCHANFEELKNHSGSEENQVWEKIAKSGLERSGSVNCFNVNYCLELAKCLKSFVSKNEKKMMDNDIFKSLYENVVELMPYFAPVTTSRHRSRSKSVEMSKPEKNEPQTNNKGDHLKIPPFGSASEATQALRKMAKVLSKYKIEEFIKTTARSAIWKEMTANIDNDFGVFVNPRVFLEGYKRSVASFVRKIPDPKERAKIFLEQIDDLLPFYDHICPRSMKKSEFLSHAVDTIETEAVVPNVDPKKRKEHEEEDVDGSSSPKSKRRLNSGGESVADSGDIPLNTTTPLRTYLKKKNLSDYDSNGKRYRYDEDSEVDEDESCSEAMDFLDECNSASTDGLVERTDEKTDPETEKAPIENELPPVEVVVAKRRGRKPKNANTPRSDPPVKRVLPSRQGTRSKKNIQVDVPQKEHWKPDSGGSPVVSSSKELVPAIRVLPNPTRKDEPPEVKVKDLGVSTKHKMVEKKKDTGPIIIHSGTYRHDNRESDDSDVEDVPLMGTNIRVHAIRGKLEQSKPHSMRRNMNPVVLLDKLPTDNYLQSSSSSARTNPIPRRIQTRGKLAESTETPRTSGNVSSPVSTSTSLERPRGRPKGLNLKPPKLPVNRVRAVPQRREPTPVEATSSTEIARQPPLARQPALNTVQPIDRSLIVRELESRPSSAVLPRHLMPMSSPSTSLSSENFSSRPSSDVNAPDWFDRFVLETRRHEMWKVHQLMKMQQELLDSEYKKRGVLEKILSALSERS